MKTYETNAYLKHTFVPLHCVLKRFIMRNRRALSRKIGGPGPQPQLPGAIRGRGKCFDYAVITIFLKLGQLLNVSVGPANIGTHVCSRSVPKPNQDSLVV